MFGRWPVAAVATLKAAAIVVAAVTAGGLSGAVALKHVAPPAHRVAPSSDRGSAHTPPDAAPTAGPTAGATAGPEVRSRQPGGGDGKQPHRQPAETGEPRAMSTAQPAAAAAGSASSRSEPAGESSTAATVTPVPVAGSNSCAGGNHGADVSSTAHDTDPAGGHGEPTSDAAQSDCGKPAPPPIQPVPGNDGGNGHDKH